MWIAVTIAYPACFAAAVALAAVAALLLHQRRPYPWLIALGLFFLAIAAGGPIIALHPATRITAMVDLSPSTRGAAFRDRAALMQRIHQLAGDVSVQLLAFSDHVEDLPSVENLPDLPCDQTEYDPPNADAILLFSDGRFALPKTGAPTYPVIDPLLIDPADAAVTQMNFDGNYPVATVRDSGGPRTLTWSGFSQLPETCLVDRSGTFRGRALDDLSVWASLNHNDLWPENDSLTLPAQIPANVAYWWLGDGLPVSGWDRTDLPSDPNSYLGVGAIALSNVAADRLSDTQQQRLTQYVRDLGGTLLIFGGDHAFAFGGYTGTELDSLSPLASDPPAPATHWILLVDSSGSMAEESGGRSRWSAAVEAMLRLLPLLPPKDIVSVGSFARDLSWWAQGESADVAAKSTSPPPGAGPNGPTNLQPVLTTFAARTDLLPCEVLLLSDAGTTIDNPDALGASLKAAKVRVSLLGLSSVQQQDDSVLRVVEASGGHWIASADAASWVESIRWLMRAVAPKHLERRPIDAHFDPSVGLAARSISPWNHAWTKTNATQLASSAHGRISLGARWQIGLGTVAAFAFTPTRAESIAIVTKLAQPPRDPRFKVSWKCDSAIIISVDASDGGGYLNGLNFVASLGEKLKQPLHQTGPGTYSLEIPALRSPSLATLLLDGRVIDRHAIAGRYAPEFDAIGNDDAALISVADRTGGQVIAPTQHKPIDFTRPIHKKRIDSYLAAAGALLLATGVIRLRLSGQSEFSRPARGPFRQPLMTRTSKSDE